MISFAREAWPFVLPFIAAAAIAAVVGLYGPALALLIVGLFVLAFFRIPKRHFQGDPDILVAPANGRVTKIESVEDPEIGPGEMLRVVTFLSVFDVHVQRAPATGTVVSKSYRRGRKIAAFRPEAGEVNESCTTVLETDGGHTVAVRQLAGLVARRVVGYLDEAESVNRGDLIGVIKFGSRVDLFVPADFSILVRVGQRVQEGLTAIARPEAGS
jgi:phosphatidylserine decarboxylase